MVEIVQKGFEKVEGRPINEKRTEPVVVAKVIDPKRDEEIGVPLSRYNINYVFQPKDPRDKKLKNLYKAPINVAELPSKVDLSADGAWGPMYDQGDLGSCVSNSVAYCIRFVRQKLKLSVYNPSRLFIYYFGRLIENFPIDEDTGMYIRSGYKSVGKYSVCSEQNWEYIPSRFSEKPSEYAIQAAKQHRNFTYLSVDHDLPSLKKCLADGYPISFGFTVFESFFSPQVARDGIAPIPNFSLEQITGGHAVTICGYDDATQRFKIANSWGDQWGDNGFFYYPYEFILNKEYCDDFWTARTFN